MHSHHHKHATPAQPGPSGPKTPAKATVAPGGEGREARPVSADDIRRCAYRKWEDAGRPAGDGTRFWLEAERELTQGG